jgi:TonB family protein
VTPELARPIVDLRPWFRTLPEQIRGLLAPAGATQPVVTSRPVAIPDLWQDYPQNPFSWANSLLIHLLALSGLLLPFALAPWLSPPPAPGRPFDFTTLRITLPPLRGHDDVTGGGGGSGNRTPLPPTRGALPPFAVRQFTPALAQVPQTPPVLAMPATLLGPPELKLPEMKMDMAFGDPKGVVGPLSGGPGSGGSFGSGNGTGVGPGDGPGFGPGSDGGYGGGPRSVGGEVSAPVAVYSPEPAYSEEARKAKFAGVVLLWIVVDAQGNVRNIQIAKPLGMGLDEEATKTVGTWKFKPAMRHGVPVPVQVQVEVSFRLF